MILPIRHSKIWMENQSEDSYDQIDVDSDSKMNNIHLNQHYYLYASTITVPMISSQTDREHVADRVEIIINLTKNFRKYISSVGFPCDCDKDGLRLLFDMVLLTYKL